VNIPSRARAFLKHLNILNEAGLVVLSQQGREMRYTLTPEPLGELNQFTRKIGARWDERLNRLKTLVDQDTPDP